MTYTDYHVIYYEAYAILRAVLIDFHNVWQAMGTSGCQGHFSNDMQAQYTIRETVETCLNAVQTTSIKNTLPLMSQIIV